MRNVYIYVCADKSFKSFLVAKTATSCCFFHVTVSWSAEGADIRHCQTINVVSHAAARNASQFSEHMCCEGDENPSAR